MGEIKQPQLSEVLRRRLMSDGSPSLSDTWVPTFVLESERPEWAYLANEQRLSGVIELNNTPGTVTFNTQLKNPSNSGMLVILEKIQLIHSGLAAFGPSSDYVMRYDTDLANLHLVSFQRDARYDFGTGGNRRGAAQLRSQIVAAPGVNIGLMIYNFGFTTGTNPFYGAIWDVPLILPPGTGYGTSLAGQTASRNDVAVTYFWRERQMASSEFIGTPG